jgi:hypothetical protein
MQIISLLPLPLGTVDQKTVAGFLGRKPRPTTLRVEDDVARAMAYWLE